MLSCRDVTEIVTEYLEGRLSLADRMRLQMHLGMCRHCRAYLRQMRQTIALVGSLSKDEVEAKMPEDVREELLRRFRAMKN
jgi:predicted anti-sigma-YlaC factor YlaD